MILVSGENEMELQRLFVLESPKSANAQIQVVENTIRFAKTCAAPARSSALIRSTFRTRGDSAFPACIESADSGQLIPGQHVDDRRVKNDLLLGGGMKRNRNSSFALIVQ